MSSLRSSVHGSNASLSARWLQGVFLLSVSAFLLPTACNSSPEISSGGVCASSDDCADSQFCDTENTCQAQCSTCGDTCKSTSDCPDAQFCSGNETCQQECNPTSHSSSCEAGVCSADGKCVAKDDIDISAGGAPNTSTPDDENTNKDCIDVDVTFEPQTPNVVLLIDQSGSMKDDNMAVGKFGDTVKKAEQAGEYSYWDCDTNDQNWRWNVVRNVLLHPDNGVVKDLEDKVRFGLALYSSQGGFGSGGTPKQCPVLTEVDLAFGTHQTMLDDFTCSTLLSDTPTRESLTATAEKLAGMKVDGPKVIVLATDGAPDNCTCANWDDKAGDTCANTQANKVTRGGMTMSPQEAEQYDVVQEALRIKEELGITVEVINVSDPNDTTLAKHLDDVAKSGGAVGGKSIPGFDPGALSGAFQSIIDGVRSCAIDLDGAISPGKESTGKIRLDDDPTSAVNWTDLKLDDKDGWRVNTSTQIELVGKACETIKTGDHELDVTFPCGSFVADPIK